MLKPSFALPALLSALTLALGLAACDADAPADGELVLRALEIAETWAPEGPVVLTGFDSCEAFTEETCAGLTKGACEVARDRLYCTPVVDGVKIYDTYFLEPGALAWRGVDADGNHSPSSAADSPQGACEGLSAADPAACLRVAKLAGQIYANLEVYTSGSPEGGLGRIIQGKGGAKIVGSLSLGGGDLVLGAADKLGWGAPLLASVALDGYVVIEDDIMLAVRPNGTISVSTGEVVLMIGDNHWEDCVECDGTIDMPIEEYILIDG